MSDQNKLILRLALVFFAFISFVVVTLIIKANKADDDERRAHALVGNIQFKGKVINYKTYDLGGRTYYLICVKLDYCNVKEADISTEVAFIKIKNNIAEMAAGGLNPYNGVVEYVEVNMNNSGGDKFIYQNGEVSSGKGFLPGTGAIIDDIGMCN